MQFGLCLPNFPFGVTPTPEAIVGIAQAADRAGFASAWVTDHILVPSDKTRYGILYEVFTTLAYVGAKTERIKLGTSVLILAQRDAILVAKQASTLDALTGGRMIIGIGAGWVEGEFKALGVDFHKRGRRLDESIEVMRALWSQDRPAFDGKFYRFEDTLLGPKPAQAGGIPIWVGGNSDKAVRRAARLGDGTHFDDLTPSEIKAAVSAIHAQRGSSSRPLTVSLRRTTDLRPAGALDAFRAEVTAYAEAGVDHIVCQFEHATQAEHLAQIDLLAREIMPHFPG